MGRTLTIGLIIAIICLIWMHYQTDKNQTKDKVIWMVLAFFIPIPTVLFYYFTQMRDKTLK